MPIQKTNAGGAPGDEYNQKLSNISGIITKHHSSRKQFPPYGRQLHDLRHQGLVPAMRVIVSSDWKLGAAYPRIVIPADEPVEKFNLDYLAGLSVQIVHHANEAELVSTLISAILAVKPKTLVLFNYSIAKQKNHEFPAVTVIHPSNWRSV